MSASLGRILLLILLIISSINEAFATHAMGADLTYRCLGPGPTPGSFKYELTYSLYRDCKGIDAPIFISIHTTNSCGYTVYDIFLEPTSRTPKQISPLCPSERSTCNGGTFTGIEEWIYKGEIVLPGECSDWTFSHGENARNRAITTLDTTNAFGTNVLFVYSTLNNTNGLCDDSPTFSNKPVSFVCLDQLFCFNHGAYDSQGDSLTYQLITPRNGPAPADTVTYLPGYSATQPVISNPPMTFNNSNGDFCMTPVQQVVTVFAVLVNEYRNGILIGQVERDIQLTVIPCSNTLPVLTGINGSGSFQDSVCAGSELCFNIGSIDPDIGDTTKVTWDASIPRATFTNHKGYRDSATFCWTPSVNEIRPAPYCFTATVADDNCPYLGLQVFSYCIKVSGINVDAGPDQIISCGTTATLSGSATGGNGIYNYTWNPGNINSQQLSNADVGTYYLTVNSAGCSLTDSVRVKEGQGFPDANFYFTNNCSNEPIQFYDSSFAAGSTISKWAWDFGDGSFDTIPDPLHLYLVDGVYQVKLIVTSASGCTSNIIKQVVIVSNIPTAGFSSENVCLGQPMFFYDVSTGNLIREWQWNFSDTTALHTSNLQNPSFVFSSPGIHLVTLLVIDSSGCSNQILKEINIKPLPVSEINFYDPVCENSPVFFSDSLFDPSVSIRSWLWNFSNGDTSTVQNPVVSFHSPGQFNIDLVLYSDSGCEAHAIRTILVNPQPHVSFIGADNCVRQLTGFISTSSIADSSQLQYRWELSDNFETFAQTFAHRFNSVGTYEAKLIVTSTAGCLDSTSKTINVYPLPVASFKTDFACEDQPANFSDLSEISSGQISSWKWIFGDNFYSSEKSPAHIFSNAGNYLVSLFVTSDKGCVDSSSREIRIVPKPLVDFITEDACVGTLVHLTDKSISIAGFIVGYKWNFGDGATGDSRNSIHEYVLPGFYTIELAVTTDSGCIAGVSKPDVLQIFPLPDASFRISSLDADNLYPLIHFENETDAPCEFRWTFGDGKSSVEFSPTHLYSDFGDYDVQLYAIDNHGCIDSILKPVDIKPTSTIFIPNTFTPNGDGKNDYFEIFIYNIKEIDVSIYDRWGLKIVEWNDLKGKWDGKVNGNSVVDDTYSYRVSTIDINGKNETYFGHVNVIH